MAAERMTPNEWLHKRLEEGGEDFLREMLAVFAQTLMSADADARCGADYDTRSPERTNRRNGYRGRRWDTRAGTIPLAIPKLREGTYFPEWLLERRNRRQIPHRREAAGYIPLRNPSATDGHWKVNGKRQALYVDKRLSVRDQHLAAQEIVQGHRADRSSR